MGHNKKLRCGEFSDVALVPPEDTLTDPVVAGLASPEDFPDYARHRRSTKLADAPYKGFPDEAKKLKGAYVYAGFALHHFGHFVAETFSRLWVIERDQYKELPLLFLVSPNKPAVRENIDQVMGVLGIQNYRVEQECVVVEKLIVGEMGKYIGGFSHLEYIGWLQRRTQNRFVSSEYPDKICVLRGHFSAGKLVGERALENILVDAGYFAFRPENYSIAEQLKHYSNATKIVFSEGSAIHLCDFLPHLKADVAVLNRRSISTLAETSLRQKARKLFILECVTRVLSPRSQSGVGFNRALSYIAFPKIQSFLNTNGFVETKDWPNGWSDEAALRDAIEYRSYLSHGAEGDVSITSEASEGLVVNLMEEVSVHFDTLRQVRYKMWLSRARFALAVGDYDQATDFAQKALRQYSYGTEAHDVYAAACGRKKKSMSWFGGILDTVFRVKTMMGKQYHDWAAQEIQIPKK